MVKGPFVRLCAFLCSVVLVAALFSPALAHGGKHQDTVTAAPDSGAPRDSLNTLPGAPAAAVSEVSGTMGFDERGGAMIPLDLVFITELGDTVRLGDVVRGPTILSILYYKCPNACSILLTGIAKMLSAFAGKPGTTPNLISVSIDETETPADARKAKSIALAGLQKPFPADHWRFLTGKRESIKKLTDTVGFRFVKKGDDFDHPLGIIILSPRGKVVRYIMGTDFLPVEIRMSLMEASAGVVQPAIARVVRACFSYDPQGRRFVFKILQVSAVVIFSILGIFIAYLVATGKSRRRKGRS